MDGDGFDQGGIVEFIYLFIFGAGRGFRGNKFGRGDSYIDYLRRCFRKNGAGPAMEIYARMIAVMVGGTRKRLDGSMNMNAYWMEFV